MQSPVSQINFPRQWFFHPTCMMHHLRIQYHSSHAESRSLKDTEDLCRTHTGRKTSPDTCAYHVFVPDGSSAAAVMQHECTIFCSRKPGGPRKARKKRFDRSKEKQVCLFVQLPLFFSLQLTRCGHATTFSLEICTSVCLSPRARISLAVTASS